MPSSSEQASIDQHRTDFISSKYRDEDFEARPSGNKRGKARKKHEAGGEIIGRETAIRSSSNDL